jgi:hypothetical protein
MSQVRRTSNVPLCAWGLLVAGAYSLVCSADVLTNARACTTESDDTRRLACYDKWLREPASVKTTTTTPAASPDQQFGMTPGLKRQQNPDAARVTEKENLQAHVATVSHKLRGELVVTLDNGQVWEQTEEGLLVEIKSGEPVTISHGSLGSFWMTSAHYKGFKVRRTR